MKTMVQEIKVYRFDELSDEAKAKVKQWYLDDCSLVNFFTEDCENKLEALFPESNLQVCYSLGYCQSDFFNIKGRIYLDELLEQLTKEYPNHFTAKEIRFFNHIFTRFGSEYDIEYGRYCTCGESDYIEWIVETLESYDYRAIPYSTLDKFNEYAQDYMYNLCRKLKEQGYEALYEISDDDLEEYCEANDYWFTEDGDIFE